MSDTSIGNDITRYLDEERRRRDDGYIEMRVLQETLECPSPEEIEAAKSAAAGACAVGEGARCAFCRLSFHENVDTTSIIKTGFCESCLSLLEFGIDQQSRVSENLEEIVRHAKRGSRDRCHDD